MPNDSTVFVDTNVLLCAQNPRDPVKRASAEHWLAGCWQAQRARISTQLVDGATVDIAWQIQDQYRWSCWDALMHAAAREQGCRYLLSEDMQHAQHVEGVQIIDPFLVEPAALGWVGS